MSKANGKLTRAAFLAAATKLHELDVASGALGLGTVWIRELTARQRLDALDASKVRDSAGEAILTPDGAAQYDDALYRAYLIQAALLDKQGGQPILTLEDVPTLAERGRECLRGLSTEILNLSWLDEVSLFRGDRSADDRQRDTDASAGEPDGGDTAPGA